MATLEDIARTLGVSKGTVSKALSGAGGVSDAMRKSVVETAVELGYSRICRKDASRRIAVFITNRITQSRRTSATTSWRGSGSWPSRTAARWWSCR